MNFAGKANKKLKAIFFRLKLQQVYNGFTQQEIVSAFGGIRHRLQKCIDNQGRKVR